MKSLKANFIINIAGALTSIALTLITVPLFVSHIGEARYGILSLVWIMMGYLGLLDFGLSQATTNALAKLHDAPPQERGSVLMTSLWSNIALGSLGGLIIYAAGSYILLAMRGLSDTLRDEVSGIMPWLAPILPLAMASGVGIGALEASERFLVSNVLQIFSNVLGQAAPLLVAIFLGPELTKVIPATLAVRALTTLVILAFVLTKGNFHYRVKFNFRRAKGLFGYGMWITVSNLISPLMTSLDQFIIGSVIGASFVARYAVPMNVASRLLILNSALGGTVFPRFSRLSHDEATDLATRSAVSIAYLSAMLFAPALVVVHPFFDFWMGKNFAVDAAPVASALFIGAWFNGLAFLPGMLLLGQGKPDRLAKLHVFEVLPYLVALWFLIHTVGLVGAAIAWSLRASFDALALMLIGRLSLRELRRALPALAGIGIGLALGLRVYDLTIILAIACVLALSIGAIGLSIAPDLRKAASDVGHKICKMIVS